MHVTILRNALAAIVRTLDDGDGSSLTAVLTDALVQRARTEGDEQITIAECATEARRMADAALAALR